MNKFRRAMDFSSNNKNHQNYQQKNAYFPINDPMNFFHSKNKKDFKYNQKFQKKGFHHPQQKPAYNFSLYFKESMLEDPWKNLMRK